MKVFPVMVVPMPTSRPSASFITTEPHHNRVTATCVLLSLQLPVCQAQAMLLPVAASGLGQTLSWLLVHWLTLYMPLQVTGDHLAAVHAPHRLQVTLGLPLCSAQRLV